MQKQEQVPFIVGDADINRQIREKMVGRKEELFREERERERICH